MLVFDLCSGTGSATVAFREHGDTVVTIDIQGDVDEQVDIRDISAGYLLSKYGRPDFIWASPPCTFFSNSNLGPHWNTYAQCRRLHCDGIVKPGGGKFQRYWHCSNERCERRIPPEPEDKSYVPKSRDAKEAIQLTLHIVTLITEINPKYYCIENPVGMMRHLSFIKELPRTTVTYCQYGSRRQKPTDLFGVLPPTFVAKRCKRNSECHIASPRGGNSGTQGLDTVRAGSIPYGLSLAMLQEVAYAARNDGWPI